MLIENVSRTHRVGIKLVFKIYYILKKFSDHHKKLPEIEPVKIKLISTWLKSLISLHPEINLSENCLTIQ